MESACVRPVGDISRYGDAMGTCTASRERDDECSAVQVSADRCIAFVMSM